MEIVSAIVSEFTKSMLALLRDRSLERTQVQEKLELKLRGHLAEVLNWAERVQFYSMHRAKKTSEETIGLSLDIPRKFKGSKGSALEYGEVQLLRPGSSVLLLGDPGSGKTTTIKRLARLVLQEKPVEEWDVWQYPIVIRLRDFQDAESVDELIADAIGLSYRREFETVTITREDGTGRSREVKSEIMRLLVGSERLDRVLSGLLDSTAAIVLLDGLDEVPIDRRASIQKSVVRLARQLTTSKIIMTCRSGDFSRHLSGFDVLEICPLSISQVEEICSKWLGDSAPFLGALRSLPFQDLATRPLFLCNLIVLYQNLGHLPDQPSTVYRRMIHLALKDWDDQRDIRRASKYSRFDPDQKIDFLSALSYELTYKTKVTRFNTAQLQEAYNSVCAGFRLPPSEAREVALEIESHTGIVVEEGEGTFEFCHLSLQEYLCAYYLVREPFADNLVHYLNRYTAPVAIAVCLSSNPSNWFAGLILRRFSGFGLSNLSAYSLMSRLVQEKPRFTASPYLGFALIKLVLEFGKKIESPLLDAMVDPAVVQSLAEAFNWYAFEPSNSTPGHVYMHRMKGFQSDYDFRYPDVGAFPEKLLRELAEEHPEILRVLSKNSTRIAGISKRQER